MSEATLAILNDLIDAAKKAGADAADAVAVEASSKSASWRGGKLEDVDGSEGEDIGLRVLIGKRQAMVSSSDRSAVALKALVTRTIDMAKAVPEDPYCGLAPEEQLFQGPVPDLELADSTEISAETLLEWATAAEDAARAVDGVSNSDGAGASSGSWGLAMATSHGFSGHYRGTSCSISVSAIAGQGTGMERDYDYDSARFASDLRGASDIGRIAGEKAVARLNAGRLNSGTMPVVFDPRVGNSLLGHFAGAINGGSIARGTSFLKDKMGSAVFPSGIQIIDDPLKMRGQKSRPFDGEGLACNKTHFIKDGVLQSWTLNSATARQLGLTATGHASRGTSGAPGISHSNLYMKPGKVSPSDLIADIKDGFYVTELIGMGVNGVTGDYSRGAAGFRIENGQITTPISEVTIASNLIDMFARLIAANDLTFKYGTDVPTLRIDDMSIAGI